MIVEAAAVVIGDEDGGRTRLRPSIRALTVCPIQLSPTVMLGKLCGLVFPVGPVGIIRLRFDRVPLPASGTILECHHVLASVGDGPSAALCSPLSVRSPRSTGIGWLVEWNAPSLVVAWLRRTAVESRWSTHSNARTNDLGAGEERRSLAGEGRWPTACVPCSRSST
jgi:hypothetical protein